MFSAYLKSFISVQMGFHMVEPYPRLFHVPIKQDSNELFPTTIAEEEVWLNLSSFIALKAALI